MNRVMQKAITTLMIMMMITLTIQIPQAHAAMITTDQMITTEQQQNSREKVYSFLQRADVQQELQRQGVNPGDAELRVAQLTDQEINMLAGNIDHLPAGGIVGTLIGAALFIFVVLLVTDILGFTDVYPFVHSHGH